MTDVVQTVRTTSLKEKKDSLSSSEEASKWLEPNEKEWANSTNAWKKRGASLPSEQESERKMASFPTEKRSKVRKGTSFPAEERSKARKRAKQARLRLHGVKPCKGWWLVSFGLTDRKGHDVTNDRFQTHRPQKGEKRVISFRLINQKSNGRVISFGLIDQKR